ncbi:MAG TPA: L-fuculose-phosphate aldolase [Geobacteraceae bacterium]|nr:L-fuculose-phosphate aldolase [Geobacteraceae bacterium]
MLLMRERDDITFFGRKLLAAGLTTGTGGNLSIFSHGDGLIAISPSGVEYEEMTPADVPVVDFSGVTVEGRRKPSSELDFHRALYRRRADIRAVVHTHSVYATTMACLNWEIPAVHYLVAFSGHKVPLAPYATFGTPELAANVAESIGDFNAVLLANHGLVTVGENLATAFAVAEEIELVARIYYQAKCIGDPVILPDGEMSRVVEKFASYGRKGEKRSTEKRGGNS